ncbi:MAG TPA: inorganic diphosphatase [Puia sp.]|jgi:inorganic pyrophosphatase
MEEVDVVIETPKGSAQKYDYDPDSHFFRLKKILPSGMVFPPEQSAKKGKDKMIRNDRFLAIPTCSSIFENIKNMDDLPKKIMDQLEEFFVDYNKLEGKEFKALKQMDAKEAGKLIEVDE